jgi:hypothetical protein
MNGIQTISRMLLQSPSGRVVVQAHVAVASQQSTSNPDRKTREKSYFVEVTLDISKQIITQSCIKERLTTYKYIYIYI